MNVFDFDGTIYDGDSTLDFYFFCIKKHPILVKYIPIQIAGAMLFVIGRISKTEFKEKFYVFLNGLKNVDEDIIRFWDRHEVKIKELYKDNKQADDVIISASPGFLLEVICNRLRIDNLVASRVDKNTGRYDGTNCSGMEKVRRFKEIYGEAQIDAFYSDSQSDEPLAKLAKKAFIVVGNDTREWEIK